MICWVVIAKVEVLYAVRLKKEYGSNGTVVAKSTVVPENIVAYGTVTLVCSSCCLEQVNFPIICVILTVLWLLILS